MKKLKNKDNVYCPPQTEVMEIQTEQAILQSSFGTQGYGESEESEW